MPMNKNLYPKNWTKEITPVVRATYSNRCAWCGKPNGARVKRAAGGIWYDEEADFWRKPAQVKVIDGVLTVLAPQTTVEAPIKSKQSWLDKVVLTVAHLGVKKPDGSPGNKREKMDCRPENLLPLCQYCHILFDADEHLDSSRATKSAGGYMKTRTGKDGKQKTLWNADSLAAVAIKASQTAGVELPPHECQCSVCGKVLQPLTAQAS